MPETSPALLWTGKVGDASAFRVWGSQRFFCDLSSDKLSPCAAPCVFLGFPPDAPGWQFYHPSSRHVLSSQTSRPPPVDPLPPQGPAPSGVQSVVVLRLGVLSLGVLRLGVLSLGELRQELLSLGVLRLELLSLEVRSRQPLDLLVWCMGVAGPGGSLGASSRREPLSPQELREWFAQRWRRTAGAGASSAAEGAGATGPGGARHGSAEVLGLRSQSELPPASPLPAPSP
ncbi:unnamed protein product [Closterium sp. NIES-64]|nr:unnamed protein product [Closterium sp. NIES-64]